ncbi:hypothetical protein FRC02_009798 [Tulasnella sp. 418]|nr:hypothetical protein FRC02_009798 [Tulasnella sp. 418]
MLFGPSDSESPSTASENQENRGTDEIRLLAYRKAYGPTPLLEPADLQYLTQHEEVSSETTRVVPSRARSLDVVDDDDEMYSSYDADDSASGTLETLSVDQDFKVVRGIRSEFRESYGYSTDESESGEAPSGGRSSRAGSVYSFHSSGEHPLLQYDNELLVMLDSLVDSHLVSPVF